MSNIRASFPSSARPAELAREHVAAGDLLYSQAQFAAALDRFQQAVGLQPDVPDYHFRVASAAWKLDLRPLVETHYQRAAELDPSFAEAHKMLAQWFVSHGRTDRALHHSKLAFDLAPADPDTRITRAVVLTTDAQPQAGWEILQPLVDSGYTSWHLASAYADLAGRIAHHDQAVQVIERTLASAKISPALARRLHVSAASLLEATGRYDDAFAHMRRAKKLVPETFDPSAYSKWVDRCLDFFTPARLAALPHTTRHDTRPLLIVGVPRSGTTLVEQILASHPSIFGGGELRTLGEISVSLASTPWAEGLVYPECLELLCLREVDRLAEQYLSVINSLSSTATYVTDKMPQNYEWLGMAALILPKCHIIHCIRDPRDTCISCFLTDFEKGNAFSNDVSHLVSYYRDYQRQMQRWKDLLGAQILDVRYEDLVADPAGQIRRLLDFLNLPWDERCLAFHENDRAVNTASRNQVRKPIYSSSIGRWERYKNSAPELGELRGIW
ncbi:MAG TPA: sulfotransferase [Tepidisphaeraceae bacterium]|nr:sulfotransferase [Tepidisphaeraceae bacterium]